MDREKALEILHSGRIVDENLTNPILVGMQIIAEGHNNEYVEMAAEHDQIWYGDFEESIKNMTEDQVALLGQAGWFVDEEGYWMHFI